jgi:hypothetical protein
MQYKNKEIIKYNAKGKAHGYWETYHDRYDELLWYKCFYVNSIEHGFEEIYDYKGNLKNKYYHAR